MSGRAYQNNIESIIVFFRRCLEREPVKITTILFCQPSRIEKTYTLKLSPSSYLLHRTSRLQNPIYPPSIKLHNTVKLLLSNCRWFSHSTRIFPSLPILYAFPSHFLLLGNLFPETSSPKFRCLFAKLLQDTKLLWVRCCCAYVSIFFISLRPKSKAEKKS